MSPNPIANDARRARRHRRLPADARCLLCNTDNPVVLRVAEPDELTDRLEEHHVAGWRVEANLTVVLCQNCHTLNHEALRDAGVDLRRPSTNTLDQLLAFLTAIATFLHHLADSVTDFTTRLGALITALDHDHPTWRTLPEASAS